MYAFRITSNPESASRLQPESSKSEASRMEKAGVFMARPPIGRIEQE
jgi:hypothetical protein